MEHLEEEEKLKSEIINELNNLNDGGILFNSIEYKSIDNACNRDELNQLEIQYIKRVYNIRLKN